MPDEDDERSGRDGDSPAPTTAADAFGRGVRTALRNNATAYGFSISITAAYGLMSGSQPRVQAFETIMFAIGAAVAFVVLGLMFLNRFPQGRLTETGQVATISGGIDLLSVTAAVATAYGASLIPGITAWPVTAFATASVYLLVAGLDIVVARTIARHTVVGRSQ